MFERPIDMVACFAATPVVTNPLAIPMHVWSVGVSLEILEFTLVAAPLVATALLSNALVSGALLRRPLLSGPLLIRHALLNRRCLLDGRLPLNRRSLLRGCLPLFRSTLLRSLTSVLAGTPRGNISAADPALVPLVATLPSAPLSAIMLAVLRKPGDRKAERERGQKY